MRPRQVVPMSPDVQEMSDRIEAERQKNAAEAKKRRDGSFLNAMSSLATTALIIGGAPVVVTESMLQKPDSESV